MQRKSKLCSKSPHMPCYQWAICAGDPGKAAMVILLARAGSRCEEDVDMVRILVVALILAFAAGPAVAKVPKGCRSNQQANNQTGECSNVIIENLNRGSSSTSQFYRSTSHKGKKHKTINK
jgi:hypothetical protein